MRILPFATQLRTIRRRFTWCSIKHVVKWKEEREKKFLSFLTYLEFHFRNILGIKSRHDVNADIIMIWDWFQTESNSSVIELLSIITCCLVFSYGVIARLYTNREPWKNCSRRIAKLFLKIEKVLITQVHVYKSYRWNIFGWNSYKFWFPGVTGHVVCFGGWVQTFFKGRSGN